MDRELPVIPTTVFIASIVLAIFFFMYSVPLISHTPVTQLLTDKSDQSWVVFKNQIIPLESDKDPLSMEHLDIDYHVGKVIPLQNSGWIINGAKHNIGLLSGINKFLRLNEPENDGESGSLLKCDHHLRSCKPWGDKQLHFKTSWRGLELADGRFIISDVTRHQVHLVAQDGQLLDTLGGFRFPNHVEEVEGKYWVVDTNRAKLVELAITDDNTLQRTEETENLAAYSEIKDKHLFPSLAFRDQQNWWALIHDNNMSDAGIYRVSSEGVTQFGSRLADPTTFLKKDQALLVADYETRSINTIDTDTKQTSKLNIPALEQLRVIDNESVDTETRNMWLIMAGIVTSGIAFLVLALFRSKVVEPKSHRTIRLPASMINVNADVIPEPLIDTESRKLFWINKNKKHVKKLKIGSVIGGVVCVFVGILTALVPWLGFIDKPSEWPVWLPLFSLLILITAPFVAWWLHRHTETLTESKVGVLGDKLLYSSGKGMPIEISPEQISYDNYGLISADTSLVWQTGQLTLFDKFEFESHVVPLLKAGNKQSSLEIFRRRFVASSNLIKLEWVLFMTAFLAVVYVYGVYLER